MQGLLLWTPRVMRSPLVPMVSPEAHRRAAGGENPKWPLWPTMVKEKKGFSPYGPLRLQKHEEECLWL